MTPYLAYLGVFTAMSNLSVCSAADLASNAFVTLSMPFSSYFCSNQVPLLPFGYVNACTLTRSHPRTLARTQARSHTHTEHARTCARAHTKKQTQTRTRLRLANVWALCIFMNIMIILVAFTRLQPPEQTRTRTRTAADCGCISGHASLLGLVLLHNAQLQRAAAASASLDVLSGQVSLHRGLHCRTADITRHEDCIAGRSYLVRTQFVSSI